MGSNAWPLSVTRERSLLREITLTRAGPLGLQAVDGEKPSLAVHVCCGPCATAVIERLQRGWALQAVWCNPNIQPAEEHRRRLEAMRVVAETMDVPFADLGYEIEAWHQACAGLMEEPEGGRRCDVCFRLRLQRTAQWAAEQSIDAIATTLTISPHKSADRINAIGRGVASQHDLLFLACDFKQDHGFQRSVELSNRWKLYRQNYCGCLPGRDDR